MQSILGQKFGRLTVIEEFVEKDAYNRQKVRCKCDCGNFASFSRCNIITGHTKSCGCSHHEGRFKNLVGERFGKLIVVDKFIKAMKNRNEYYAICKCDCGKEKTILVCNLLKGKTTSCGCRRDQYEKITGSNSKCFKGYEEISGLMIAHIKNGAKNRDLEFAIDPEYIWKLFLAQDRRCALSGREIGFNKRCGGITASLDRINNSKGYVVGNVQWVHKDLNRMRNYFGVEYFIETCKQVAAYHSL